MLHVTNGDAVVPVLRERGVAGEILPWRDVLHDGPVRSVGREQLARERAEFLAGEGGLSLDHVLTTFLERDRTLLEAVAGGEPLVLWFEDDLYDQLQLLQVLDMAGEEATMSLIELPRRVRELPDDPTAESLDAGHVAFAHAVWEAFRAGDVVTLNALADERDALLAHVPVALGRLLQELPWTGDGLSRVERAALQAVAAGVRDRREVFLAVAAQEERPFLGDERLFARLDELAPLLDGDRGGLSALGREVLEGGADWLRDGTVDRWLGGLRLRSPGPTWRWEPEAGAPVVA